MLAVPMLVTPAMLVVPIRLALMTPGTLMTPAMLVVAIRLALMTPAMKRWRMTIRLVQGTPGTLMTPAMKRWRMTIRLVPQSHRVVEPVRG